MAVICFKIPRWPFACINLLLSIALFAIGVGTCVASGYLNMDRFYASPGTLRSFGDSFFVAMLIVGLAAIIVSIIGCSMIKIESRALPACYGCCLFPIWIIFVVLAAVIGGFL